jgi:glycosyltransferase involved in cell wall biosynthesis
MSAGLSVIIPCRDAAGTLGRQLEALAGQPRADLVEIIVADNGSRDATVEVARECSARLRVPEVRVIDASARAGASFARNCGAAHARGDRLAFCDGDDVVGPEWITAMSEALSRFTIATGPLIYGTLNESWVVDSRKSTHEDPSQRAPTAGWMPFAIGANVGTTRAAFDAVGGFDETMPASEDIDFSWRAQLAGGTFHFEPRAVVHYHLRHSLGAIFRQARFYAQWYVCLVRKHAAAGCPHERMTPRMVARKWKRTLVHLPRRIGHRAGRAQLLFEIGTHLGRMQGSVRFKYGVP